MSATVRPLPPPGRSTDDTKKFVFPKRQTPILGWRWRNWKQALGITPWQKRECPCATLLKLSAEA
jgi:hypothetical protein